MILKQACYQGLVASNQCFSPTLSESFLSFIVKVQDQQTTDHYCLHLIILVIHITSTTCVYQLLPYLFLPADPLLVQDIMKHSNQVKLRVSLCLELCSNLPLVGGESTQQLITNQDLVSSHHSNNYYYYSPPFLGAYNLRDSVHKSFLCNINHKWTS